VWLGWAIAQIEVQCAPPYTVLYCAEVSLSSVQCTQFVRGCKEKRVNPRLKHGAGLH
jgi:hypothetical protein